jgi:membrane-associated phospholipid phosphatase
MSPKKEFILSKNLRFSIWFSLSFAMGLGLAILFLGNETLFLLFNQYLTPQLGFPARLFSWLGESWAMGFVLIFSLFTSLRNALLTGLCWLSGAIHSWVFKLWLCKGWPRPMAYFSERKIMLELVDGVKIHYWNSFPSGHTITAFSLLVILPILFPKFNKTGMLLLGLSAMSCGLSRIILVQHWPVDVLAGVFLGCSAALTSNWLGNKIFNNPILSQSFPELIQRKT